MQPLLCNEAFSEGNRRAGVEGLLRARERRDLTPPWHARQCGPASARTHGPNEESSAAVEIYKVMQQ